MREISLCSNCKLEGKYPDCGAKNSDYKIKKGIGVIKCKRHKLFHQETNS